MSTRRSYSDFAALFKKYRLRSEIETLSEFGNLLAEEGYIYEDSLFTRWQKGERVPKDRRVLLTIIELFAKRGGIENEYEANRMLESVDHRDLTQEESILINDYFHIRTITLPVEIPKFIGRVKIINKVVLNLINKKNVFLLGIPGVGKTAMGIHIGHLLKNRFSDGIFWFRADIKKPEAIVDEIGKMIGIDDNFTISYEKKISKLNQIIAHKNVIIILDNLSVNHETYDHFYKLFRINCPILITSNKQLVIDKFVKIHLTNFSNDEYLDLAEHILGRPYVLSNISDLNDLGKILDFLPLTSSMILNQVYFNPIQLKDYIKRIKKCDLSLHDISYDNKNFFTSLEICVNELDLQLKNILISASIFEGNDFDIRAISFINSMSRDNIKKCIDKLLDYSFINLSIKGRYRINSSLKSFLQTKLKKNEVNIRLITFYEAYYKGKIVGDKIPFDSLKLEIDNILGLIEICYQYNQYDEVFRLWKIIHTYLWLSGNWTTILKFHNLLHSSFSKLNDKCKLGYYLVEDLAKVFFFQHRIEEASLCLSSALKIADNFNCISLKALVLQKYAVVATFNKDYKSAEQFSLEAVNLLKGSEDYIEIIRNNIYHGHLCLQMKNNEQALYILRKSFIESTKRKLEDLIGMSANYLGQLYLNVGKYNEAEKYFKLTLSIDKKLRRKFGIATCLDNMSRLYKIKGEFQQAENLAKSAVKIYEQLDMKDEIKRLNVFIQSIKV